LQVKQDLQSNVLGFPYGLIDGGRKGREKYLSNEPYE